jgi:hypothetical protein
VGLAVCNVAFLQAKCLMLGLCEGVFWKGDLWVLEDKNGTGSVFDWIVDFSILCLYSLYLFLLSLICFFLFFFFFFFLLTFCLNLSGRDKHLFEMFVPPHY